MLASVGCPFGRRGSDPWQVQSCRPTGAFACHDPPDTVTNRWIRAELKERVVLQDVPLHAFGRARRHWSLVLAGAGFDVTPRRCPRTSSPGARQFRHGIDGSLALPSISLNRPESLGGC